MNILADFREIPPKATSGIYAFVAEDSNTIYYVGQSVNILNRYRGHSVKQFLISKGIKFKFIWRDCLKELLDKHETDYIVQLKPLLNTVLNWEVSNKLKDEYKEYINASITKACKLAKEIEVIELKAITEAKKCYQRGQNYNQSAVAYRVNALLSAINRGEVYSNIKALIKSAPNKGEVITDMGTFKGWTDFLTHQNLSYKTVERYIFMYEHRREFDELKLISKDPNDIASGAAGHRKAAAIEAVKWYLEKIAQEGEHIRGTLTACDYQQYRSQLAQKGKNAVDSINLKLEQYFSIMAKLKSLEKENEELKSKLPVV